MDWIGHHNDIAHWALGMDRTGPSEVEAVDWVFPETDVYDTPAEYEIRCKYPNGVTSTISMRNRGGLKLIGDDGWLFVTRGRLEASDSRWTQPNFDPGPDKVYQSGSHTANFLECVRARRECVAPAEIAHRSITPGHLGYVSQMLQRPLRWDAENERIIGDEEANEQLYACKYRKPWG
jgi:hypothetical protein